MTLKNIIELVFFFGLVAVSAYLVYQILAPFLGALTLAAIVVTLAYPLYRRIQKYVPRKNESFAAGFTVAVLLVGVIVPVSILVSLLVNGAISFVGDRSIDVESLMTTLEETVQNIVPGFSLPTTEVAARLGNWFTTHISDIFSSTANFALLFFVSLIAMFYFFRDGTAFVSWLIKQSPLSDKEDILIVERLARAIRSVAFGTVLLALIQGVLTTIGFAVLGFDGAILFGFVAAVGALIPGLGTAIVFVPATVYLVVTESYGLAAALGVWGFLAVGLIDNVLGPYLMSRGNSLHPFLVLLSVLGGMIAFGPLGFIIGPVVMTLFKVMLELYALHNERPSRQKTRS